MPIKILKKRAEEDNLHMQTILLLIFSKKRNYSGHPSENVLARHALGSPPLLVPAPAPRA